MRGVATAFAILSGLWISICVARAQDQQPAPVAVPSGAAAGEQLFKKSCSVCHSTAADKVLVGPSLHAELQGTPDKAAGVRAIIENGKGKMQGFKERLTDQELDSLIAYLRTQ